jgi:hypothetical protein
MGKHLRGERSSQGGLWAQNNVTLVFTLLFYNKIVTLHYFMLTPWLNTGANMRKQLCPHISYHIIYNIIKSSTHVNRRHKITHFQVLRLGKTAFLSVGMRKLKDYQFLTILLLQLYNFIAGMFQYFKIAAVQKLNEHSTHPKLKENCTAHPHTSAPPEQGIISTNN